jgi:hypothetical protein
MKIGAWRKGGSLLWLALGSSLALVESWRPSCLTSLVLPCPSCHVHVRCIMHDVWSLTPSSATAGTYRHDQPAPTDRARVGSSGAPTDAIPKSRSMWIEARCLCVEVCPLYEIPRAVPIHTFQGVSRTLSPVDWVSWLRSGSASVRAVHFRA